MLINLSAAHLSVGVSCDVCSSCVYVVNIIIVCHGQSVCVCVCVWGGVSVSICCGGVGGCMCTHVD